MTLEIYDSLAAKKRPFEPKTPGKVQIYVCGMTVYDYCHIGHARSLMAFDMVVRYLRFAGYTVNYVRNITDIDDKIIRRAQEVGEDWQELVARFIEAMEDDEQVLSILPPDHQPRATKYIAEMIELIEKLFAQGIAYVGGQGDVCFAVERFADYGRLSRRDLEQLRAGARIQDDRGKQNPLDFVLWKPAKPGEPQWDSPWGPGRPGWHIECSAMSEALLGLPFDIHGGGMDLKFPHHENEIAQSVAGCGCGFANYWMHSGLLNVEGEKMSKSLGNFVTIREALQSHSPEALRYFMLSSHYRSPVNYSEAQMSQARSALERLYVALRDLPVVSVDIDLAIVQPYLDSFSAAMDDDFNTPEAFAVFFQLARDINRLRDKDLDAAAQLAALLRHLGGVLGLLTQDPADFLQGERKAVDSDKIDSLIAERQAVRAAKDWSRADAIRDELAAMGVVIEDSGGRTTWRWEK